MFESLIPTACATKGDSHDEHKDHEEVVHVARQLLHEVPLLRLGLCLCVLKSFDFLDSVLVLLRNLSLLRSVESKDKVLHRRRTDETTDRAYNAVDVVEKVELGILQPEGLRDDLQGTPPKEAAQEDSDKASDPGVPGSVLWPPVWLSARHVEANDEGEEQLRAEEEDAHPKLHVCHRNARLGAACGPPDGEGHSSDAQNVHCVEARVDEAISVESAKLLDTVPRTRARGGEAATGAYEQCLC